MDGKYDTSQFNGITKTSSPLRASRVAGRLAVCDTGNVRIYASMSEL